MFIVNIAGILLIALIVWWFWLYKSPEVLADKNGLIIIVDHGIYQPSHIKMTANKPKTLIFLRKDTSPCSETLVIPDLKISETLPLNKNKIIRIPAMLPGNYKFHCQMQMHRGQITVE